jgi:MIP family channel proteins
MPALSRRLLAEAFGTYTLIFFGAGSILTTNYPKAGFGLLGIAIAHGLALALGITATMNISGGHLNPAVTLGLFSVRRIDAKAAAGYILAQLAGACLAAYTLKLLLPSGVTKVMSLGTPMIATTVTIGQATAIEAVLTFFLMSAVMGTAVSASAPKVAGFGIGLMLLIGILIGGPLTGAALNPARAFGPALVAGHWVGHLAYWIGPVLGAVVAAFFWEKLLLPKATD